MASLQATLSREGVPLPRGLGQQQQPWQQQDMPSPLLNSFQQHLDPAGGRQQAGYADTSVASQTSASLGQVGNDLNVIAARLQGLHRISGQQQQQQQPSPGSSLLNGFVGKFSMHTANTAVARCVARPLV
jgi:hypothetical protein